MKELLAVLVMVVAAGNAAPQYNQAHYSTGPQKYVQDKYGQYHPVSGPPVGPPFGVPYGQGGHTPHAASSLHQQQPFQPHHQQQFPSHQQQFPSHQQQFPSHQQQFPSHQQQFPSHQQQFPSHQQQLPSHQQQFPSHQQQFPSHQHQQLPSNSGGDVPFIPLPPNPNTHGKPSVTPIGNTELGAGFDVSAYARTKADSKDKKSGSN